MDNLLITILVLAIPAATLYFGVRWIKHVFKRGREMKALAEHGTTVAGYIKLRERIIRSRAGTSQLYLTYQFQDASGQEHTKRLRVFESEFKTADEGEPVEVVYLREDPEVNALRYFVDEMRAALNKQQAAQ